MEIKRTSQITNNGITVLVYGQSGVGKTTLIKTLPGKVLILSAEAGLLSLKDTDIEYVDIRTLDDLTEAYSYILSNITEYNCIVLDSLSEIAEVVLANEKRTNKDVYYFDNLGHLNTFEINCSGTTGLPILDNDDLLVVGGKGINLSKSLRQYRAARVSFSEIGRATGYLIYSNTTGRDSTHPGCNLELSPGSHFDGTEIYTQPSIFFERPSGDTANSWVSPIREISCNVCNLSLGGFSSALKHMRYFSGYGFALPYFMFKDNISLICIRHLDTGGSSQGGMMLFSGCISLLAIPVLDTSEMQSLYDMFANCISLEYVPDMDTSNASSMESMFQGCSSLRRLPEMDVSNVYDFRYFAKGCIALNEIGLLNTSNGTDFDEMFSGCINLKKVNSLNTSNAVSMVDMFKSCHSLVSVPPLHTERIATLNLFEDSGITALVELPVSERTTTLSFENMKALTRVSVYSNDWEGCNINFSGTCLSRDAYVEFFQSLPTIATEYTITLGSIIGGTSALTVEDRSIATNKGWTLT